MLTPLALYYPFAIVMMVILFHIKACYSSDLKILESVDYSDSWEVYSLDLYLKSRDIVF